MKSRVKNSKDSDTPWKVSTSVPQTIMPTPFGAVPVTPFGYGINPYLGGYYNPNYLFGTIKNKDEEIRQLRNQVYSHKEAIGELEEQVDTMNREGTRFDDIIHQGNQDIQTIRERYTQPTAYGGGVSGDIDMVSTADPRKSFRSVVDTADPRKTGFKWADAEMDQKLHNLASQEQELLRIKSSIPENTAKYKKMTAKLDNLVRQRIELEKKMYNRADYDQYYKEKVIDDQKKDNIAQWLRRDLKLFEKEAEHKKYKQDEGFIVYWDFILNLIKEYRKVQIIYGMYNRGLTVFEPRIVELTDVNDTTHPNFCQVIFDINHLVRDIEAHPDSMLIFEIQVPINPDEEQEKKRKYGHSNTGYRLSSQAREISKRAYDEDEFDDANPTMFHTYGWSLLDIFNFKHNLKRGTYKVPIYKPPTIINLDFRDLPNLERIPDTMIWMRVAYPKDDEFSEIRCDPSHYHMYTIPEIHNFAPKIDMFVKPERDPYYICDGITAFVHYCKGYQAFRHVRVALCIQLGKDIVIQENGGLCFYATKGVKQVVKSGGYTHGFGTPISTKGDKDSVKSILKNALQSKGATIYEDFIEFNDGKEWLIDFYKLFWDEDLNENLYCVVQYLQRKEGVIPTVNANISRKLIEDEYDLVGYSVIQLNNPDGTVRYGTYTLDLYQPPVYVEELDDTKRTNFHCKVTIGRPGVEMDIVREKRHNTPPMPGSEKKVQINDTPQVSKGNGLKTPRSKRDKSRLY